MKNESNRKSYVILCNITLEIRRKRDYVRVIKRLTLNQVIFSVDLNDVSSNLQLKSRYIRLHFINQY